MEASVTVRTNVTKVNKVTARTDTDCGVHDFVYFSSNYSRSDSLTIQDQRYFQTPTC